MRVYTSTPFRPKLKRWIRLQIAEIVAVLVIVFCVGSVAYWIAFALALAF